MPSTWPELHSGTNFNYVWDVGTLTWVKETQPGSGSGGGGTDVQYVEGDTTSPATGTVALVRNASNALAPLQLQEDNSILVSGSVVVVAGGGGRLPVEASLVDPVTGNIASCKAPSTLPALTDYALVTTQRDPLPTGTNVIGSVLSTPSPAVVSTLNSSTTPLGSGAAFVGTFEDVSAYPGVGILFSCDQSNSWMRLDWSNDASTVVSTQEITGLQAASGHGSAALATQVATRAKYVRVRLENDSVGAQTVLLLQLRLLQTAPPSLEVIDLGQAPQYPPTTVRMLPLTGAVAYAIGPYGGLQPLHMAGEPSDALLTTIGYAGHEAIVMTVAPSGGEDALVVRNIPSGTQVVSAVALPLPTGAATDTLQTSGNTTLTTINGKIPALGQALAAASAPVVLTAIQAAALTPPAAITGFALEAGHLAAIDTHVDVALSTRLKPADTLTAVTTVGTITNVVHVDDNAGSLTVDGTVALAAGVAVIGHVINDASSAVIGHVITDTGSTTAVTGNVTVVQSTGTNLHVVNDASAAVIGHVIADTGSTTAVTGSVAVTSAGLTNLDVALSTRTKPADQQHAIIDSGTTAVTQATPANLQATVTQLTLTKGTQGATGVTTQDLKDAGRVSVMITASIASTAVGETLITLTRSIGLAATGTGSSLAITTGKRFRIQGIYASARNSTGTVASNVTVRLRAAVAGATTAASPLQMHLMVPLPASAVATLFPPVPIPDGFEIDSNAGTNTFGVTITHPQWVTGTQVATFDLTLIGYEY